MVTTDAARAFIVSPSADVRQAAARAWLAARNPNDEVYVVGATLEAAAFVSRSFQTKASFGWHRTTPARLAWSMAAPLLAEERLTAVGTLALEALAARVLHALPEASLPRLWPIVDRPGLPRALLRTADELRLAGLTPDRIDDADLRLFLHHYERELSEGRLADRASVLRLATATCAAGHGAMGAVLLLDVPLQHHLESAWARELVTRAPAAFVTVPKGDTRTLAAIEALKLPQREFGEKPPLLSFQEGLFDETPGPLTEAGVMLFSAPGESRECVEMARFILKEAARGVRFDEMAVALRAPEAYRAHLAEALRRAKIPVHFAKGTVLPSPSGRAFLALLACASEGLSAARFAEYLSLGESALPTDQGEPPPPLPAADRWVIPDEAALPDVMRSEATPAAPDEAQDVPTPRHWERLIVDAAVIGSRTRWEKRLDGLRAAYEMELRALDEADDPRIVRVKEDLHRLASLRRFAMPLIEELDRFPKQATWGIWLERLSALATRALRDPERVLSVLAELMPMASVGPVDLAEVRLVLEKRLTDVTVPPGERRFGRVFAASIDELRGLSFRVVFVPGLAERVFPQKIIEDPLLTDAARMPLDRALRTNADRSNDERLALRLAAGAAKERLVFSYPRIDTEQGRPRTPSFYGLEILRAADGVLGGFEELRERAFASVPSRIGWPAPARSEDAIDEAEHDLALIEGLLVRPEAETIGMARYLLGANVHLGRALRFRAKRWTRKWTECDGLIDVTGEAKVALDKHALSQRSFSPTALQHFAACPYRFVMQAIFRLAPREEPAPLEDMDPLTRGSLMHEVQYELLTALRAQNRLPVTPDRLEDARAELERTMEKVAARHREELFPAIPRVWDDGVARVRADLVEWLRRMSLEPDYVPVHFELAFGPVRGAVDRDAQSVDDPVKLDCGIQLRGSIDLVEARGRTLRATDYKSGKIRAKTGDVIAGGATLQPVLYALTLEKLFVGRPVEGGRLYYCTSAGDFTAVDIPLDERARKAAELVARTVQAAIETPFLPAAPEKNGCEYCDYARVCGPYEAIRTGRKGKARLAPLVTLRKEP